MNIIELWTYNWMGRESLIVCFPKIYSQDTLERDWLRVLVNGSQIGGFGRWVKKKYLRLRRTSFGRIFIKS